MHDDDANDEAPSPTANPAASRPSRRSFFPRFGLRSLLVFGLVFCLVCGWIGRNFVRIRREDAAIETLKQAGATIYIGSGDEVMHHPATPYLIEPPDWDSVPSFASRLIGWSGRAPVRQIELSTHNVDPERFDVALATLAQFPEVKGIDLIGPGVTDETLQELPESPDLDTLALAETSVTARGLANLRSPSRFRYLSLFRQNPPADAIAGAPSLPELRWVQLVNMPVTRADMAVIASLPKLKTLRLIVVQPSEPDVFAPLAEAKSLRELTIHRTSFGDADIASSIGRLPDLESLWLEHTDLTDAGLADLGPLKRLKWLGVMEPVTLGAVRAFAEAHPTVIVTYTASDGKQQYYLAGEQIDRDAALEFKAAAEMADD